VELLISIGDQYSGEEENTRGRRVLEEAYQLSRGLQDKSARARASCALAESMVTGGDLARAEVLFQEGLRELPEEPQFGSDRIFCLVYGNEIAYNNGDSKEAIARAEAAQRVLKESPAHSPVEELTVLMQLAAAYGGAGKFSEAITAFEQASERMTSLGYDETQKAAKLFNDWGVALNFAGRPLEAEKAYRRAINVSRANQTEDAVSPYLLYNYSLVLRELGRLPEASDYADRAYTKAQRAGDQMLVGLTGWQRARIYRDQHDFTRATAMLEEAEPKLGRTLPPGHFRFAALASDKSLLAGAKGDRSTALQLADQAVAMDEAAIKAGGQGATLLPILLVRRSEVELEVGRQDQAAADATRSLDLLQTAAQPRTFSSNTGRAYLALGRALQSRGKLAEAHAAFHSAVEHLQSTLGPDHPETRSARQLEQSAPALR
jgi:tetratricopeptide (TPR) repeat protein